MGSYGIRRHQAVVDFTVSHTGLRNVNSEKAGCLEETSGRKGLC